MQSIITFATVILISFSSFADLNLYTDRPAATTKIIADAFKASTGVNVNVVELKYPQLLAQLKSEGVNTNKADVIFVKDMIYLNQLNSLGFFQPLNGTVAKDVAPSMKSANWSAITYRARAVIYNTTSVTANQIKNYSDLAKAEWTGRLCLRTAKAAYNTALVANMIADSGKEATLKTVSGWVSNLAVEPFGDDTEVIDAIASGVCEVGIVNSYYLGRALAAQPQLPVGIIFVDQNGKGNHTNGSGAGISKSSKQAPLASQLIQLMLSNDVQKNIVATTFEFPANKTVAHPIASVRSWQGFKANTTNWSDLKSLFEVSDALMTEAQFN